MTNLFKKGAFLAVSLSAALICGTAFAASSTVSFTASYKGQGANSTSCNTTDQISGMEPAASGKYPVFVFTVGTTETFTNTVATAAVQDMANAGFVAATVNYDTATFGNCSQIGGKAQCIYNSSSSSSAISALCSRAKADCSKGIFTSGASQGAVIATLAKNFDSQVQAVYGIADGVMYTRAFNLTSCMANGNRKLPSNMLRAVNGLNDQFTGVGQAAQVTNFESLTGFNCGANAVSCLQSNGSGWVIVQQNQLASTATDDHCYPRTGGCNSNQNSIQQGYLTGNGDWALPANLGFLQSISKSLGN